MKLNYFESALQCKFKIRVLTCFYSPGLVPHSPKSKERVRVQKVGPGEVSPSLPGVVLFEVVFSFKRDMEQWSHILLST